MRRAYPTLDQIEGRTEPCGSERARPYRDNKAPGTGDFDMPLGHLGGCWCGLPDGHDWPGKSDRAPHPREERNRG